MGRVKMVYEPDSNSGRVPNSTKGKQSLLNGKVISVKKSAPDDYKTQFEPKKSGKRMEVNRVPKTMTPKGFTKMQLTMSVAKKKYDDIVHQLQGSGKLWEDPDFPANDSSIGSIPGIKQKIEWKRARDINPKSAFIVGGVDRSDVKQGALGDCWLLAVISSMADVPCLFNHIVPQDQPAMSDPKYCGIFRFRFWQFGQWVEILVDDRLPVYAGSNNMVFMHSDESNEMWSALMEKAYAKMYRGYAHLSGGTQGEAMEDMTAGLCETLQLQKMELADLTKDLFKYTKRCNLMGCSITSQVVEAQLANGLIAGHAYSITDVAKVHLKSGKTEDLIRVRNPWGNNYEWKGNYADRSPSWNNVTDEDRKRLDVEFGGDGEFWMTVPDFMANFTKLEVCHLGHESLEADMDVHGKKRLEETLFLGEWTKNITAGGCANFKDTFPMNPQFRITVTDSDPTDDEEFCTLTIGLMQAGMRKLGGAKFHTIGFCVYKVGSQEKGKMGREFFASSRPAAMSEFTNTREVVARVRVLPGTYVIVPSTYKAGEECNFIIRAFTEVHVQESECDDKNELKGLEPDLVRALKVEEQSLSNQNEDAVVKRYFDEAVRDGSINAEQLRDLLNKTSMRKLCKDPNGFQLEAARSMLAAQDNNQTGKLEWNEFDDMWESFQCWKVIFQRKDTDGNKLLNALELRHSLTEAGFKLTTLVFTVVVQRFTTQGINAVTFEDWLLLCVRLKNCFENLRCQAKTHDGSLLFTQDDFLRLSLYQ